MRTINPLVEISFSSLTMTHFAKSTERFLAKNTPILQASSWATHIYPRCACLHHTQEYTGNWPGTSVPDEILGRGYVINLQWTSNGIISNHDLLIFLYFLNFSKYWSLVLKRELEP